MTKATSPGRTAFASIIVPWHDQAAPSTSASWIDRAELPPICLDATQLPKDLACARAQAQSRNLQYAARFLDACTGQLADTTHWQADARPQSELARYNYPTF